MTTNDVTEKLSTLTDVYNRLVETDKLIADASKQIDADFAELDESNWFSNPISYTASVSEPIEKAREAFTLFVVRQLNDDYKNLTIDTDAMNEYTKTCGFDAESLISYIRKMYADEDGATLLQIKTAAKELISYSIKTPDNLDRIGDTGFELSVWGYEYDQRRKVDAFLKLVDITLRGIRPSEVTTKTVEIGKVYKDDKVKSLRYFKNNALKVVFHTVDDCEKVKVALFTE